MRCIYRIAELDPLVGFRINEFAVDEELCFGDGGLGSIEGGSRGGEGTLEGRRGGDPAQSSVGQHGW